MNKNMNSLFVLFGQKCNPSNDMAIIFDRPNGKMFLYGPRNEKYSGLMPLWAAKLVAETERETFEDVMRWYGIELLNEGQNPRAMLPDDMRKVLKGSGVRSYDDHGGHYGLLFEVCNTWFETDRNRDRWNKASEIFELNIDLLKEWVEAEEERRGKTFYIQGFMFRLVKDRLFMFSEYNVHEWVVLDSDTEWELPPNKCNISWNAPSKCYWDNANGKFEFVYDELEDKLNELGIEILADCERFLEVDEPDENWKPTGAFALRWWKDKTAPPQLMKKAC